jgi:ATP synthase protein I
MGSYGTVGLEVVLSLLFGLFVGQWADSKLGTDPWLMLLGAGFGLAAAVRALIRAARAMQRETENDGWRPSQADRPARFGLRDTEHNAESAPDPSSSIAPDHSAENEEPAAERSATEGSAGGVEDRHEQDGQHDPQRRPRHPKGRHRRGGQRT